MKQVTIYTDGSCTPNPGLMSWAAVLECDGVRKEVVSDYLEDGTNQRAELLAVINGLRMLKKPCIVTVVSDSQYVVNGVTEWNLPYKGTKGKCANNDLWADLYGLLQRPEYHVSFQWQRGHVGHRGNERADTLAYNRLQEKD